MIINKTSKINKINYSIVSIFSIILTFYLRRTMISSIFFIIVFSLSIIMVYRVKRVYVFSLSSLFFIFFNIYSIAPIINFLIFKQGLLFSVKDHIFYDPDNSILTVFINYSLVCTTVYTFFIANRENLQPNIWIIPIQVSMSMIIFGVIIFFIEAFLSGAIQYMFSNRGFFYSMMNGLTYQKYLMHIGIYYFAKGNGLKRKGILAKLVMLILLGYILLLVLIGFRGQALIIILLALAGHNRNKSFKIKISQILIIITLFLLFVFSSVYRSTPDKDINNVFRIMKDNPLFFNLGSIEYGASYMNFAIAYRYGFELKYPLQSYIVELKNLPISYIAPELKEKHPIMVYRDMFFLSRYDQFGDYGSSGFSLILDAYLNFGSYTYWILFILFAGILNILDRRIYFIGKVHEIFYIIIIPYFIQIGRSGVPVMEFMTKYIHSVIILALLTVFLHNKKLFVKRLDKEFEISNI